MLRSITLLAALTLGCTGSERSEDQARGAAVEAPAASPVDRSAEAGEREAFLASMGAGETAVSETSPAESGPSFEIEVRPGENLVLLAGWADVSVEDLTSLNGIDAREFIVPGQALRVPEPGDGAREAFHIAREAATDLRLDRYVSRRGGLAATETHTVRTGETAWGIAHDEVGVPTWVLARFNPDVDLERLGIGDELRVPVLGDMMVAAMEGPEAEVAVEMPEELEDDGIIEVDMGEPGGLDGVELDELRTELPPPVEAEPRSFMDDEEAAPEVPISD